MVINVLTLFPAMFHGFLAESIPAIAQEKGELSVNLIDIRDFSANKNRQIDDYPYGGGAGMVIKPEPLSNAIRFTLGDKIVSPVIYFTPQGKLLNQSIVRSYLEYQELTVICGHYKEIDQRIRDLYVTEELSIGDYVLSGGELPAMVFIDAISRLLDNVLSDAESANTDSHENELLGCPHYTRPYTFEGLSVPEVLVSGNHKNINEWRNTKSIELTMKVRPDILGIK